jgi:hypothetical protein
MNNLSKIGTNGKALDPAQLQAALFDVQDALERSCIPFLVLREVARSLFFDESLSGDNIVVCAYDKYFTDSCLSILKMVRPQLTETKHGFEYTVGEVPVEIRIIRKHFKFLDNPDIRIFYTQEFMIPNPFNSYWKTKTFV